MKQVLYFLNQPFPIHLILSYRYQISFAISAFVTLFLLYFRTFDDIEIPDQDRTLITIGYGVICMAVMNFQMMWVLLIVRDRVEQGRWKVYHHMLSDATTFIVGALAILVYHTYLGFAEFTFKNYLDVLVIIVTIVSIPGVIAVVLLYNYSLRLNLQYALEMQQALRKIGPWQNNTDSSIVLTENPGKEVLQIPAEELLLISSADNYIDIHWNDSGTTKHQVLRQTMKAVEEELSNYRYFFRCHRTAIVNLNQVKRVTGNSVGCKLEIHGIDEPVSVSRSAREELYELMGAASAA